MTAAENKINAFSSSFSESLSDILVVIISRKSLESIVTCPSLSFSLIFLSKANPKAVKTDGFDFMLHKKPTTNKQTKGNKTTTNTKAKQENLDVSWLTKD